MYGLSEDIKKYIDIKIEKNKTFLKNLTFYNNIDYPTRQKYVNKYRQRTYRTKNKIIGKKQLNFYVSEDIYNSLQVVKNDLNMSYTELIEYLLNKELQKWKKKQSKVHNTYYVPLLQQLQQTY